MTKSIILGAFVAFALPALAIAAPGFQPATDALVAAERATTLEPSRDAAPLVIVRETESRQGRGRGRP